MDQKLVIMVGGVLLLTAAGIGFAALKSSSSDEDTKEVVVMPVGQTHEVVLMIDGFEPQEITIAKGDMVVFRSERPHPYWPASDQHPAHSDYSDFDPRRPVNQNETWEFQFTQSGTWDYHDHLNSTLTGTVHVTE